VLLEILAAALKDHHRGLSVGETTFAKQWQIEFPIEASQFPPPLKGKSASPPPIFSLPTVNHINWRVKARTSNRRRHSTIGRQSEFKRGGRMADYESKNISIPIDKRLLRNLLSTPNPEEKPI